MGLILQRAYGLASPSSADPARCVAVGTSLRPDPWSLAKLSVSSLLRPATA